MLLLHGNTHFQGYVTNAVETASLRYVVSFTPPPLYPPGKSPWYELDRRLGGAQGHSGRGGEEKNSQPGIEP
jgi:hypothetical protein